MKAKASVVVSGASFEIGYAVGLASVIHRDLFNKELVVTSVRDSQHNPGSLHPKGLAADIRTRDLSQMEQATFKAAVVRWLEPAGFDVVLELDHLHIEFDPKTGEKLIEVTT